MSLDRDANLASEFTGENRREMPHFDGSVAGELSHGHFHEIERFTDEKQNDGVRNEESASAVLVRRVRKSPHVT